MMKITHTDNPPLSHILEAIGDDLIGDEMRRLDRR